MNQRQLKIDAAWRAANAHAHSVIDQNSRETIGMLLDQLILTLAAPQVAEAVGLALPEWQQAKVLAYTAWWKALWLEYERVRRLINKGQDATYDPTVAGPCPGDVWWLLKE